MKISCIIPAYNEEKNISRVLDIISTYPNFQEIIVIDDGSSDNTCEVIKNYKNIKLIHNHQNLGKTTSIIKVINQIHGELIVFIDADLINLRHENMDYLISALTIEKYDLAILDRAGDRKSPW